MSHLLRVVAEAAPFTLTDAEIEALGYVVVTRPPYNADKTGALDATTAIQAAIDDGYADNMPIWFPSGTYLVSNTLRCYQWAAQQTGNAQTNEIQLFGANPRPVLKVNPGSGAFNDALTPRPVVGFAKWRPTLGGTTPQAPPNGAVTDSPTTRNHIPSSPYIAPHSDWQQAVNVLFDSGMHNIDIDTSEKPGADGLFAAGAQGCFVGKMNVTATSSRYGILGLPGRSSPCMDITVQGGQIGVSTKALYPQVSEAMAGSMIAGLRCFDQTTANIEVGDFVPLCITGFHFTNPGVSAWAVNSTGQTAANGATLIDGIIEIEGGSNPLAIDNDDSGAGVGLYLRNIYVTGTTNLIKSGSSSTVTGTGTWKRIDEYSANRLGGTAVGVGVSQTGSNSLQHFAYIDGTTTRVQEHANSKTNDAGTPPTDMVERHVCSPPALDETTFINITAAPYSAVSGSTDSRAKIQAAIDAAAVAGHNRVLVPAGSFAVSSPGLTLGADTKLFGVGKTHSVIAVHSSWVPTAGTTPRVIQTVSDIGGATQMAWLTIPNVGWNVGRKSSTFIVDYSGGTTSTTGLNRVVFGTNGGGRHYNLTISGTGHDWRGIKGVNNTQPLAIYGWNSESSANFGVGTPPSESGYPDANAEFTGSSNVRFYSCKKEGPSPTVTLNSCTNVGVFSGGGMRDALIGDATFTPTWESRFNKIMGTCEGIVFANIFVQVFNEGTSTAVDFTLYEEESDGGILWPNGVALYKRGYASYDDTVMTFT